MENGGSISEKEVLNLKVMSREQSGIGNLFGDKRKINN